jgi:hypothetical protein
VTMQRGLMVRYTPKGYQEVKARVVALAPDGKTVRLDYYLPFAGNQSRYVSVKRVRVSEIDEQPFINDPAGQQPPEKPEPQK